MIEEAGIVKTTKKVSRYAVAFVVAGGIIWVFSAVFYSAEIARCFSNLFTGFPSCSSVVLPSSSGTAGFPPQAVHWLAWDDLYANLYIGAIGLLAIAIGLTGLRRGRKWVGTRFWSLFLQESSQASLTT